MAQAKQDMGVRQRKKAAAPADDPGGRCAGGQSAVQHRGPHLHRPDISGIGAAALTGVGLFTPHPDAAERIRHAGGRGRGGAPPLRWGQGDKEQAERSSPTALPCCCSFRWC